MAISGILLFASTLAILVLVQSESSSSDNSIELVVMILVLVSFLSVLAVITFSKTGWRVEGSEDEWAASTILNPSILIFRGRNKKEQEQVNEKKDQEKDDEHYRRR